MDEEFDIDGGEDISSDVERDISSNDSSNLDGDIAGNGDIDLCDDLGDDLANDSDSIPEANEDTGMDLNEEPEDIPDVEMGDNSLDDNIGEDLNGDFDEQAEETDPIDLEPEIEEEQPTDIEPETEDEQPTDTEPEIEDEQPTDNTPENQITTDDTSEVPDPNDVPDEYGSSFNDRIRTTPINNGDWSGERGDSRWTPNDESVAAQLSEYGVDGIDYNDGFPDFSPVATYEHHLPNELHESSDPVQFRNCNNALAEHLINNPEFGAHFDEAQHEAIHAGKTPSGYTWHHDVEAGRMQLVPSDIHGNCRHHGGRSVWGGGTANRKYLEE